MSLIVIIMIFFDASLMQFLESHLNHQYGRTFNHWLYYVFVTLATVGYGDITPHSVPQS
jgi:Ion channel